MKRKTFWKKLQNSYLLVAIIPISLLVIFLLYNMGSTSLLDAKKELLSDAEFVSSQIESQITNLSFLSLNTISNDDFRRAAQKLSSSNNSADHAFYLEIERTLCTYAIQDSIYDLSFFTENGFYATSQDGNHSYTSNYRLPQSEIDSLAWIEIADTNYGQEILLPISTDFFPQQTKTSLSIVRAVRNPGRTVGYLAVSVDLNNLDYIFKNIEEKNKYIYLVSSDGNILYHTEGMPDINEDTSKYISESFISNYSIKTICFLSKNEIFLAFTKTILPMLFVCLLLFTITLVEIKFYGRRLSYPIIKLTEEMETITLDNLEHSDNEILYRDYEEIYSLYSQFRIMVERLSDMVQHEILMKTLNIRERFHSLQAQINPHFLYNTLNTIGIMGIDLNSQEIYNSCAQLSTLLRYSIADKNDELSTLGEELDNAKAYLELIKLRLEHRMNYTISVDEELLNVKIPHLTLQPFLENSFDHGFDDKHTTLTIGIEGRKEKQSWTIKLTDNGKGIPKEKLNQLFIDINEYTKNFYEITSEEDSIGIKNTIARLTILFGKSFSYRILSSEDSGTTVILSSEVDNES